MIERTPGKRIVIEGNDGTGKTTVADMIGWQLRQNGMKVIRVDEPNSPVDEHGVELLPHVAELRRNIKDGSYSHSPEADLAMFNTARFLGLTLVERPALAKGVWIVKARDRTSSEAYQGEGDGLGRHYVRAVIDRAIQDEAYNNPDFKTILVFNDEIERRKRIEGRGQIEVPDTFESRDDGFQDRVNGAYPLIGTEQGIDMTIIEAAQSREVVADIVLRKMMARTATRLTIYNWEDYAI